MLISLQKEKNTFFDVINYHFNEQPLVIISIIMQFFPVNRSFSKKFSLTNNLRFSEAVIFNIFKFKFKLKPVVNIFFLSLFND